jgi:hypothetical protein
VIQLEPHVSGDSHMGKQITGVDGNGLVGVLQARRLIDLGSGIDLGLDIVADFNEVERTSV